MLRKLALSLAVAGALGTSNASALGLGEIQIKSALNEPLQAEIQLLQMRELDPQQVLPRMANIDEFALAGIEKLRFLADVKFEVKPGAAGRGTIIMTSSTPVKEPFLNFLVEVNWPSGRLVREYTVLLDPPVYDPTPRTTPVQPAMSQAVTPIAAAEPVSQASGQPVDNIKTRMNPGSQIYVDVNDTLWNLAKKYRPADNITEAQMMLALQRKNPDAFENNNVNQLKAGVVLDLPTLDEINRLSPKQANEEFWRQTNLWKQGAVTQPQTEQLDTSAKKDGATPKKGTEVASDSGQGQLKIVSPTQAEEKEEKTEGAVSDQATENSANAELIEKNKQLETELATALETVDQIQRENEELNGRVDALAQQMESLQRLLDLKDQQLAELQAELEAAKQQPVVQPASEPPKKSLLEEFGLYIAGAGAALVALLAALLFLVMGRRKKKEQEEAATEEAAVAPVVDEVSEIEEEATDLEEEVVETEPEAVVEEEIDELSDLADEDLDDLSDLDLEMDLDEVAPTPDQTIDDEEFDLGLEEPEADDQVAETDEIAVEDEEIDDALDSILGEDAESLDLDEPEIEDDILEQLDSVEEQADEELTFDVQPIAEDAEIAEESIVEHDDTDLAFDLDMAEIDSDEVESAAESDELVDLDELLAESEADAPEPVQEVAEEELTDLDELLGEDSGDDAGADQEIADLDELLADAGDEALSEVEDAEVAEVADQEIADLEELLAGDVDDAALDVTEDASIDEEIADLDDLLNEAEIDADLEETAGPDAAEELAAETELHPDLEQLLDSADTDSSVVLEEDDLAETDLGEVDDLEASISHDLDAELDSELEDLLSGAGDNSVSLSDDSADDDAFDGLNLLEGADEVETKLDLARAYIDMEDFDGAKDILQEIIKEGSTAQQQEANTLIDTLNS